MTADEVLEAMARASFMRGWATDPNGMSADEVFALRKKTDREVWKMHIANTRAAIRALPQGWVVAQVPAPIDLRLYKTAAHPRLKGYNSALAAVRASAVEVE